MIDVRKWLYKDNRTRTSGTVWPLWGGHITADHVYLAARSNIPHFASGPVQRAAGLLDVCMFGVTLPRTAPREPIEGETVTVSGFPAGCGTLEHRYAKVYLKRSTAGSETYAIPAWIGKIDKWHPPYLPEATEFDAVYGGMSGGLVSCENGEPLGVLITQNGLADLDGDGFSDDSFDFVSLRQVWEVFNDATVVT